MVNDLPDRFLPDEDPESDEEDPPRDQAASFIMNIVSEDETKFGYTEDKDLGLSGGFDLEAAVEESASPEGS